MLLQGDKEFYGADNKFEEARAEENAFNAARVKESVEKSRSQRSGNMDRYVTVTANYFEEEEEE